MKKPFVLMCWMVLVLGWTGTAQGVPMQDLFAGQSIFVDDKIFFDWELIGVFSTDPSLDPDFSQIDVVGLADQPLNPGLQFIANNQLVATDMNFLDVTFSFSVATSGARSIKDNSLELVNFEFGPDNIGGLITVIENISDASGTLLAEKEVDADFFNNIFNLFDSADFAPQQLIAVEKNILVAGDLPGDVVSLDVFEQRFSQVPEPSTLILVGGGLVGLMGYRRKRRNK